MPQNSLNITRNVRGGVLRVIRIIAAAILLYYGIRTLFALVVPGGSEFNANLSPVKAGGLGVLAGCSILLATYWLRGTIVRAAGVLLFILMVPFIVVGHLLTLVGAPDGLRRMPMAFLLVGCTLIYTGEGEWTLIPFARRKIGEQPAIGPTT